MGDGGASSDGHDNVRLGDLRRRLLIPAAALGGLLLAVHAVGALAGDHGSPAVIADGIYLAVYALTLALCVLRAWRGPSQTAWRLAVVGLVLWTGAEVAFRVIEPNASAPYPVPTQLMLAAGFAFAFSCLGILARERISSVHLAPLADAAIGGLVAAAIMTWVFSDLRGGAGEMAGMPPVTYLVAAVAGLVFVTLVVGLTGWHPGPGWTLITFSIAVNVLGDVILVADAALEMRARGDLSDTMFAGSVLLLGLAALHPNGSATDDATVEDRVRVAPPLFFGSLAVSLLVLDNVVPMTPIATVLAVCALVAAGVRLAHALAENHRLLQASREEARTDNLTGLGNRRSLALALDDVFDRGEPSTLAIFDLDGFKGYNDSFGHPAGDSLLRRMGERLTAAVPAGTAFRIGGDEFCLVVPGDAGAASSLVARCRGALTEHGDGFAVNCSFGVAEIPTEAETAEEAVRVADGRLYEAKNSRPGAARGACRALVELLAEREPDLHEHLQGVSRLATATARRLGLARAAVEEVTRGAELHDIGKMAIPDAILHKPGPLDEEEWSFVRQHTVIGERVLLSIAGLRRVAAIVRSSHEHWDGNGYPDELAGDDIPIGARIIAVCDAYDAMRSERPYSAGLSRHQAIAELRRCSGNQFDPDVVAAACAELTTANTERLPFPAGSPVAHT